MKNLKTEITKIHYNKEANGVLVKLLDFASLFYGAGSRFKNFLYDKNIIKPHHVKAFVISVGNLTTGGVGKTPVVAEFAKYLINRGDKPAIISRGYGGKLSNKQLNLISDGEKTYYNAKLAGDEPYWLSENVKGAVVVTSKNRFKAAQYAIEKFGVNYIILDDGFQHRKLYRDLDIVLMDSEKGFGREKLMPAGPLREGTEAFSRVDKLVIVSKNTDHTRAEKLAKIMAKKLKLPTAVCRTEPDYAYNIKTSERLPAGSDITAVSAIGQPEQFFAFLKDYNIKDKITFDDHHSYSKSELSGIEGKIVTTEKDAVKMLNFDMDNIYALKLKTELNVGELLNAGN